MIANNELHIWCFNNFQLSIFNFQFGEDIVLSKHFQIHKSRII